MNGPEVIKTMETSAQNAVKAEKKSYGNANVAKRTQVTSVAIVAHQDQKFGLVLVV